MNKIEVFYHIFLLIYRDMFKKSFYLSLIKPCLEYVNRKYYYY